jgi:hypothetical protein
VGLANDLRGPVHGGRVLAIAGCEFHRLENLERLLGPVGDHPFAFIVRRDDIVHVLVNEFHVRNRGLHQASLLPGAFDGHLESAG